MTFTGNCRLFSEIIISIIVAILVVNWWSSSISEVKPLNNRPIIGVMTQATPTELLEYGSFYVPATYVKFIESAGARVVPIIVNKNDSYYEELFNSINGVLWPGGGLDDLLDSGYGRAGKIFYDLAIKSNKAGDYFPIWGTCQGFELIVCLAAGENVLAALESIEKNLNVKLSPDSSKSKLISGAPAKVLDALTTKSVAYNYHSFSLTPANYSKSVKLVSAFNVVSTSMNAEKEEFISMIEAKDYPFYGVQFHPEKPPFTWVENTNIKHDPISEMVSQYFANFFVNEARLSYHNFTDHQKEQDALIYNYTAVYLRGKENLDQAYFFNTSL